MAGDYDILLRFLDWAVVKNARQRYHSVLGTKFGEIVFASALCHKFESQVRSQVIVSDRPINSWDKWCRLYCTGHEFGQRFKSVHAAFEVVEMSDSWLIVTEDSNYGLHRGELYFDNTQHLLRPRR
ncbi:hypothetical protein COB72_10340 [bacterium]|nr:MAG: hypothetical protein COB72_10340 [bacterium]